MEVRSDVGYKCSRWCCGCRDLCVKQTNDELRTSRSIPKTRNKREVRKAILCTGSEPGSSTGRIAGRVFQGRQVDAACNELDEAAIKEDGDTRKARTMKKAARMLLSIASIYALVYIVGAFGHASFDIREWNPNARGGSFHYSWSGIVRYYSRYT